MRVQPHNLCARRRDHVGELSTYPVALAQAVLGGQGLSQGMLDKRTIIAFSATNEPERAKQFYRDVLGLPLREESPFALVFEAGGTMLRVQKARGHKPAPHTLLGFEVPDIAADAKALHERGVRFERYPGMEQDALGIWSAPDNGAKIVWFKDPDGNLLSLTQFE